MSLIKFTLQNNCSKFINFFYQTTFYKLLKILIEYHRILLLSIKKTLTFQKKKQIFLKKTLIT